MMCLGAKSFGCAWPQIMVLPFKWVFLLKFCQREYKTINRIRKCTTDQESVMKLFAHAKYFLWNIDLSRVFALPTRYFFWGEPFFWGLVIFFHLSSGHIILMTNRCGTTQHATQKGGGTGIKSALGKMPYCTFKQGQSLSCETDSLMTWIQSGLLKGLNPQNAKSMKMRQTYDKFRPQFSENCMAVLSITFSAGIGMYIFFFKVHTETPANK